MLCINNNFSRYPLSTASRPLSPLGKPSFHIFLILFIFIFEIYEVMAFSLLGESARRAIEGTSKK